MLRDKYLLLTEFEVRTEVIDRVFSPSIYGQSSKRAGHKSKGKKRRIRNLQYEPRRRG